MKKKCALILLTFALFINIYPQNKKDSKDIVLDKTSSIVDRAAGIHNASNIGLFFENRGKLYPRTLTQGPCGEYPINSGHHYIWRFNPFVRIPGNVIQGRYTDNEEWEAVGEVMNPELSQIAFSDKPLTWHSVNGWPVKDNEGNPIIL